ncbi:hypothetical protein [Methylobacterium aerolatum]|uniref:Uncharacterized protein n=1 Tax=Methylobacterium aerolatum TaxID=418708 RepID=A0ABU0HZ57_9HYPH|nr:hypothetical protein [Methylobacterium aerolatum]MDQ0447606.1 hypothetical protein [Methylobacterium aerolatum]GJD34706.1 hypothetical protein FMGBMHLM_1609 [Methylobacterium aerolatum]
MIKRSATAAITLALLFGSGVAPAWSGERKLFENIRGWEIERNVGQPGAYACQMSYSYRDKDDDDAENAIVMSFEDGKVNLVLGYGNWEWDKDEAVQASFSVDKQVLYPKQGWVGEAKLLWSQLPDAVIPKLLKGKQIILKFSDGAADFSIPGFADAYDGVKRCNAAVPTAGPQASATPAEVPNQIRLQAYMFGLMIQKAAASCAVSTTAPQRAAVDAKVSALRAEFATIEPMIREEMSKSGPTPDCPKDASSVAVFDTELKSYLDQGPEEFVASAEKRSAERAAVKKAEAEAKAKAEDEAKMRAEIETKMRAEAEAKSKAEAETKARADLEARIRAEVEAKLRAEAEAKAVKVEAAPKAEAEAKP